MVDPANSGPIRLQRPRLSRSAGDERQWVKWVRWVKWGRPTRPRGRARTGRILGAVVLVHGKRKQRETHLIPLTHLGVVRRGLTSVGLPVG